MAALLTLVLGVGANALVFAVVYGLLLKPLPYADADSLVQLDPVRLADARSTGISLQEFSDWRSRLTTVRDLAAFSSRDFTLSGTEHADTVTAGIVSDTFFMVLGTQPAVGRLLHPADDRTPTVVLSHRLWLRRFGADLGIVGRSVTLDGRPYQVAGVAPEVFRFPEEAELWMPMGFAATFAPAQWNMRGFRAFSVIGRLHGGSTLADARLQAAATNTFLTETYPRSNAGVNVGVVSIRERQVGSIRPALILLLSAVGLLLLVAVANLMSLTLTRSLTRTKEFALRTALGAGRWALVRPVLAEALLMGLIGGGLAAGLAAGGLRLLLANLPSHWPSLHQVGINWTVLVVTLGLSLLVTLVSAALPAYRAASAVPMGALRHAPATDSAAGRRWSGILITAQICVSVVLLVGGAVLTRSLVRVLQDPVGIETQGVLTTTLTLPARSDGDDRALTLERVLDNIGALPGVRAAGVISHLPPAVSQMSTTFPLPDPDSGEVRDVSIQMIAASPTVLPALGVPLKAGRWFTAADSATSRRVVVLSETAAREFFGHRSALGRTVAFGGRNTNTPPPEVVGVVGDVKYSGLHEAPDGALYMPVAQRPFDRQYLVVKTGGAPEDIIGAIRRAIAAAAPTVGFSAVRPLEEVVAEAGAEPAFRASAVMALALITIVVAGVGLYNLVSRSVTMQTPEIGLRMALGSSRREVIWLMARRGLQLSAQGLAAGMTLWLWIGHGLTAFLFGVPAIDPLSLLAVGSTVLLVTAAASVGPIRRAVRIDPLIALKNENQ